MNTQMAAVKEAAKEPVLIGQDMGFERIRRITGYLVGTVDRFNNAKRAEEHDRVKHGITCGTGEREII